MKSEIGECVSVLYCKAWGKTRVGNKIWGSSWWRNKLKELINTPTVIIEHNWKDGLFTQDGTSIPNPIPFEQEMGWTEDTSEYWLEWLRKASQKIYDNKTIT